MTKSCIQDCDPNSVQPLGPIGVKRKHKRGGGGQSPQVKSCYKSSFKRKGAGRVKGGLMKGGLMRGGLMRGGLMRGGLMRIKGGKRGKGFLASLLPMGIDLISNIFK